MQTFGFCTQKRVEMECCKISYRQSERDDDNDELCEGLFMFRFARYVTGW